MSKLIDCGFKITPFLTTEKSEQSFTSTAANTIAEWAKLLYEKFENAQEVANAVSEYHLLIGSETPLSGRVGKSAEEIKKIFLENSENIIDLKAMCAWMREAIKFKEKLGVAIDCYESPALVEVKAAPHTVTDKERQYVEYLRRQLFELKSDPTLHQAEVACGLVPKAKVITADDVKEDLGLKIMFDLLRSEAAASVYGKIVHKGGHLKRIKDDIMSASINPVVINGTGASTVAVTKNPSMTIDEVEELEMKIQRLHREQQTKFNSLTRTEITDKVNSYNLAEAVRYKEEYEKAIEYYKQVSEPIEEKKAQLEALIRDEERRLRDLETSRNREWREKVHAEEAKNAVLIKELHAEAKDLRIILPNDLKKVYEQIKAASQQS